MKTCVSCGADVPPLFRMRIDDKELCFNCFYKDLETYSQKTLDATLKGFNQYLYMKYVGNHWLFPDLPRKS